MFTHDDLALMRKLLRKEKILARKGRLALAERRAWKQFQLTCRHILRCERVLKKVLRHMEKAKLATCLAVKIKKDDKLRVGGRISKLQSPIPNPETTLTNHPQYSYESHGEHGERNPPTTHH